MSGGHFNYKEYQFEDIAKECERIARENPYDFRQDTINVIRDTVAALRLAQIMVHRVDWLVSGDDGEDTFHKRLSEELTK